ncbi:MAG TPA: hypothetical protein VJL89_12520 [Thermodesulfovibrionia bacterium]|nr:hypothetical protein [Thermodesulfovibrionia bacterium]
MRTLPVFFLLLFLTFVTGCISLKKTYPEKHQFMLDVPQRSTGASSADTASVLLIRSLNVSPLYENKGFVYFKGQHTYASDFYNEFFIEPGPMLTEALRKWLNSAGLFAHVLSKPGEILPDYILEGTVTALYGDYSQENQYRAVL